MDAFGMPKKTDEEKLARKEAIETASKYAMEIPFKVMQTALESMEVIRAMAETGNPNSVSDAGVGALCALTAVEGAWLNVKINAGGIEDSTFTTDLLKKAETLALQAKAEKEGIIQIVDQKIAAL
jgi:glutamate formiminotransferase/formiminotetrahydrofolate cyclodeaminase